MSIEAVGHNGTVVWSGQWVIIDRERSAKGKGAWGTSSRTAGRGQKRFAVASITAIQILLPHDGKNPFQNGLGYIEFSFSGGHETKGLSLQLGTAAGRQMRKNLTNENAVMFGKDQVEQFVVLKEALESEISRMQSSVGTTDTSPSISMGDELSRIAAMYREGLLTEQEFTEAKSLLLRKSRDETSS